MQQPERTDPAYEEYVQRVQADMGVKPRAFDEDHSPFAQWLRGQTARRDRVGAVARVAKQAVDWPAGMTRAQMTEYFRRLGARPFVLENLRQAWDEFEKHQRVGAQRAKNKAARAARRNNRPKRKR